MNKVLQLFVIASVLSLTACGGGGGSSDSSSSNNSNSVDFTKGSPNVNGLQTPESVSVVDE